MWGVAVLFSAGGRIYSISIETLTVQFSKTPTQSQEAQLPQRNSASAAHVKGRGTRSSSPLSLLWLHLCAWSNPKATTYVYVKRAVRKAHFKMNRAFKVIQGHPYWCRQESRMVCCHNVQLMPTSFLKLRKIRQRENGKFVDFNDLTQV